MRDQRQRGSLHPRRLEVTDAKASESIGRHIMINRLKRIVDAVTTRLPGRRDAGAATAEYAIVIMAAVGFAGLLGVIMRSDEVRGILTDLIQQALTFAG
jgi:hypothetical protein